MSELQNFLLVVDRNKQEAIQIAEETAQSKCYRLFCEINTFGSATDKPSELEAKQATLIDVVQSLGEYINDEDGVIRGKAVSYLTAVVKALPSKFLTRQQIQVLASFYCDRIEDGGAIAGLDRLQSLDRFNKEMAKMTARA
jgi:DNA repair/transcription protein MET18/MMS19